MNTNKSIFLSQQLIAMKEANIFDSEVTRKIMGTKILNTILPGPFSIFEKEIVKDQARLMCGYNSNSILGYNPNVNLNPCQLKMINDSLDKQIGFEEYSSKSRAAVSMHNTGESLYGNIRDTENDKLSFRSDKNNYINNINDLKDDSNNITDINQKTFKYNLNTNKICSTTNKLFKSKERSRFKFVDENSDLTIFNSCSSTNSLNTTHDSQVEVPNFVSDLIYKKVSRYSFFKNFAKDDEDFTYFDNTLIREYTENNPWATFIINNIPINNSKQTELKSLIEKEKLMLLKKFNSA